MNGDKLGMKEWLDLYSIYEARIQDELNSFFRYFNFYVGLLSAVLAATIAGLINPDTPTIGLCPFSDYFMVLGDAKVSK